ncbi:glycosyltransferase [Allofranklinella schreckenbergeri]|uniref:Glycosyltransferase n=1 Tax=Allofranklinella schreckenbergeri TaxID=1076744 RepID=A0A3M6QBX8_9BURK|nr:glycosyltransferase [Allofranklinella schreckenbergeri]RMX00634.1 glycosyltransferase [Allofranklinella schreckenbergeri]
MPNALAAAPASPTAAPASPTARHVLCMKWGTKYGPEYVNRLYAMARRHLSGALRFICLTDDEQGIRSEVECFPIPELDWQRYPKQPDRAWKKLATFSPDLCERYGLRGTALFLDLDVVVVGALDPFFEQPGPFRIIHDYARPWKKRRITGNSSVYRFEIGAHPDVLEYFQQHVAQVQQRFRNEQAYLSDYLHRQGQLAYWPEGWCPSFKYHCIPTWPTNFWREPFIPKGAKVIVFHGECNPPDALAGLRNRRFRYIRPASWIQRDWIDVANQI